MSSASELPPTNLPAIGRPAEPTPVAVRALSAKHPAGQPGQQPALTATFVLRAVQQWWKIAIPTGLLLAAAAAAVVLAMFKPEYQATAWLLIRDPSGLLVRDGGSDSSPQFVRTQVQLITSPVILAPVLEKVGQLEEIQRADDDVNWLAKNVKVTAVGGSDLYRVDCSTPRAESAHRIVTAVVAVYMDHHRGESERHKLKMIELLVKAEAGRKTVVERLKERIKRLAEEIGGQDPLRPTPADFLSGATPLQSLRSRLISVEVEREVLKAQVASVEQAHSRRPKAVAEVVIETRIDALPDVRQGMQTLLAMRSRLAEVERKVPGAKSNPYYKEYEQKVKDVEKELATLRQNHREVLKQQPPAEAAEPETEFSRLKQRLVGLDAEYNVLKTKLSEQLQEMSKKGGNSAQLDFERGELAREEKVFEQVATRRLLLETEMDAPTGVQKLRDAETPKGPIEAWPFKRLLMACLAAFCVPFAVVVVWERLTRRIGDSEQLSCESALAIVGEISQLPTRPIVSNGQSARRRVQRDLGLFQESIDSLRTCLLLSDQTREMRVFSVTSAISGEGKTSLASQLAVSIARSTGKEVLLIDSDMRSPDVHAIFQARLEPGLAELLCGKCRLDEAIQTDVAGGVHILAAGQLATNPHKLVGRGDFERMIAEARQRYEYTVIDTPPILCASESLVISRAADGTLLCALRDVSRSRQVRLASERLTTAGAVVIGAVLSGTPFGRYAALYGQYTYDMA
jgi:succinoglycan biosynthesis transport protein ExoP